MVFVELGKSSLVGGVSAVDDGHAHDDFDAVFDEPDLQLMSRTALREDDRGTK